MTTCFYCGVSTRASQPHGSQLPVYCPECLHNLRATIVKQLAESHCLKAYELCQKIARDHYPIRTNERTEAHV